MIEYIIFKNDSISFNYWRIKQLALLIHEFDKIYKINRISLIYLKIYVLYFEI